MTSRLGLLSASVAFVLLSAACAGRDVGTAPASTNTDLSGLASTSASTTSASGGITGTVGTLSGSCPSLTFKLEGKVIKTGASTRFDGGVCADVKNGGRVTVTGPTQADQSVAAEKVTFIAATTTTTATPTPSTPASITGTVSALAGACAAISFKLEGKTVRTNSATKYEGGVCADVKNGTRLTISGPTQADQSVLAEKVTVLAPLPAPTPAPTPAPATTVTITGTINSIAGTCPAVTFVLEAKKIVISAATTYERGSCAELRNGIRVTATGVAQSDGTIAATRVAFIL